MLPPHVLPEANGVAEVLAVLMVPLLVIVPKVPNKVLAAMLNVPPAVVVSAPFTTKLPPAVFVPIELLRLKLLYVPFTTVWPPVVKA